VPTPSSTPEPKDTLATNPIGVIKDIYLTFFQEFFAGNPAGQFRFTGNDKPESELHVTDAYAVEKEVLEQRPALVILRGPVRWGNIGLDQIKEISLKNAREVRTDLILGTMTIHCIARVGLEAERLSWEALFALKSFRRVLQRKGLFEVGRDAQMGSETPPGALVGGDSDPHTIDVPIFSPFSLQYTWSTEPTMAKTLGAIEIAMKAKSTTRAPANFVKNGRRLGKKIIDFSGVNTTVQVMKRS